jgi:hypothetical protein
LAPDHGISSIHQLTALPNLEIEIMVTRIERGEIIQEIRKLEMELKNLRAGEIHYPYHEDWLEHKISVLKHTLKEMAKYEK